MEVNMTMRVVSYSRDQVEKVMGLEGLKVEDVLLPGEIFCLGATKNKVLRITPSEVICQRWEKKPPLVKRVISR